MTPSCLKAASLLCTGKVSSNDCTNRTLFFPNFYQIQLTLPSLSNNIHSIDINTPIYLFRIMLIL